MHYQKLYGQDTHPMTNRVPAGDHEHWADVARKRGISLTMLIVETMRDKHGRAPAKEDPRQGKLALVEPKKPRKPRQARQAKKRGAPPKGKAPRRMSPAARAAFRRVSGGL